MISGRPEKAACFYLEIFSQEFYWNIFRISGSNIILSGLWFQKKSTPEGALTVSIDN